jgi:hypothetical protein
MDDWVEIESEGDAKLNPELLVVVTEELLGELEAEPTSDIKLVVTDAVRAEAPPRVSEGGDALRET